MIILTAAKLFSSAGFSNQDASFIYYCIQFAAKQALFLGLSFAFCCFSIQAPTMSSSQSIIIHAYQEFVLSTFLLPLRRILVFSQAGDLKGRLQQTLEKEGILGLWKGTTLLLPQLFLAIPLIRSQWFVELLVERRVPNSELFERIPHTVSLMFLTLLTHPLDFLYTHTWPSLPRRH